MKTNGLNNPRLSGKVDDSHYAAYYQERGYSVIKRIPEKKKKEEWSDKQKLAFSRFKSIQDFTHKHLKHIVRPVWNKYSSNGYNTFIKTNKLAFNEHGELAYPHLLKITIGDLPEAVEMEVNYDAETRIISIEWLKDNRLPKDRDKDMLFYASFNEYNIIKLHKTTILRGDLKGLLEMPRDIKEKEVIYFFFTDPEQESYSNSQSFEFL